jgi:hypothetical protein
MLINLQINTQLSFGELLDRKYSNKIEGKQILKSACGLMAMTNELSKPSI